ncbi:hypothetical protein JQX13_21060 [Archangium violaceum]|uniref:hypothetical protein n=1 Tax=Archangium violaceum TaxID=83451 RepID=UPI00193BDA7E|nr:hypothetical protein [Archangium violaceum]QRK12292.1 hypothetical protein JQX13_21060 [Archangium violaceum]
MTELTVIDCAQPPPPNGEGTQLLSLSGELSLIEEALTGAANLAELLAMKSLGSEETAAQTPLALNSLLVLVTARMTHLRRVLSCETDPRELLATHNSVPENELGDADVRLRPWTAAQRVIHLRRLLAKAEAEAKREEPTQPSP